MKSTKGKPGWLWVLLGIAALAWWGFREFDEGWNQPNGGGNSAQSENTGHRQGTSRTTAGKSGRIKRTGGYEAYSGCVLVRHRNNDGDSFHVRLPDGREEEFRLYYVDAPESHRKHYRNGETNLKRIGYQARYFGISSDRAVEIGSTAKKRVLGKLGAAPFTVYTKWEPVFESGRYFAFVQLPNGQWLHEWLVREGLARIYTKGEPMPDGTSVARRKKRLHVLESEAKRAGRGAWKK